MILAAATATKIIDCDTHFWQPAALWKHFLDRVHREMLEREEAAQAPRNPVLADAKQLEKLQSIKAGDDPAERLNWMDQEGSTAT